MRMIEDVKHILSREEKLELADELAQAVHKAALVESEKSIYLSDYKAEMKKCDTKIADLSRTISNGFEMRPTEVLVAYDAPQPGWKRIVNLSTSEVIREEMMTPEELQQKLDFTGGAEE